MNDRRAWLAMLPEVELRSRLDAWGVPGYRAEQVGDWLYRRWVTSPAAMANLPRALQEQMAGEFRSGELTPVSVQRAGDGTTKLLLRLADGERLESVVIPARSRLTFCLSSQVGCPVRCRFCASGRHGLVRNLAAGEMVEQLLACCREAGRRPDNLVFMGIGEPLWNVAQLLAALERIGAADGFAFSPRRITVSTSGWTPGIRRLARVGRPWHLALSLHAPDDALRAQLIPDECRRPLDEVLAACCEYREVTGRIVTFEYLLLGGVNDRREHAIAVARLARECRAKVNLIPYNEVPGLPFARPSRDQVGRFAAVVSERGAPVTVRREMGGEVFAACGQLRATVAGAASGEAESGRKRPVKPRSDHGTAHHRPARGDRRGSAARGSR